MYIPNEMRDRIELQLGKMHAVSTKAIFSVLNNTDIMLVKLLIKGGILSFLLCLEMTSSLDKAASEYTDVG